MPASAEHMLQAIYTFADHELTALEAKGPGSLSVEDIDRICALHRIAFEAETGERCDD